MGQNGAVVGQVPHFGPFSLKKISKRAERDDWPNCRKCSFLIFFPTCNHVNLNFVIKDHVHQKMVKIG